MKLKAWTVGFFAAVFLLLPICAKVYAADTSVANDIVSQAEDNYYTLVDPQRFTLIHEVRLVNTGAVSTYDLNISVSLMDNASTLYTNRLREQLIPWPDYITTDEFGRRVAYYHVEELAAGQELLLTQKYVLECSAISYPQLDAISSAGYEEQLAAQYLLPSKGIESDNEEIIAFARQAVGVERDTYAMAKAAFAAVNLYMTYEEEDTESPNRGALRALHRARGVCEEYSKLYVAVLRALGIAARQQSGYLYLPAEHNKPPYVDEEGRLNLNLLRHAWAEFYLPGKGWVIADPTFTYSYELDGVPSKFINWSYFAGISRERLYIFFREESLNEESTLKFGAAKNADVVKGFINGYLLAGSQAAYFNDVENHWAEEAIMRLAEREEPLLQGMGNGMFGVNDPMTRAQLVTCLQRLMKAPPAGPKFTDLSPSHWAYRDIGAAQQAGWISGYPDGSFRPNTPISRAELAQLLVTVFDFTTPDIADLAEKIAEADAPKGEFAKTTKADDTIADSEKNLPPPDTIQDLETIEEEDELPLSVGPPPVFLDLGLPGYAWADDAITTLYYLGFAQGDGQGYYQPARSVTRAEFATFLDRIITAVEEQQKEEQQEAEKQEAEKQKKHK